jgi:hypothetical protein
MYEAYGLIFSSYCNKTFQSSVEQHLVFETTDSLLRTIWILMQDLIGTIYVYAYALFQDAMQHISNNLKTKSLVD